MPKGIGPKSLSVLRTLSLGPWSRGKYFPASYPGGGYVGPYILLVEADGEEKIVDGRLLTLIRPYIQLSMGLYVYLNHRGKELLDANV